MRARQRLQVCIRRRLGLELPCACAKLRFLLHSTFNFALLLRLELQVRSLKQLGSCRAACELRPAVQLGSCHAAAPGGSARRRRLEATSGGGALKHRFEAAPGGGAWKQPLEAAPGGSHWRLRLGAAPGGSAWRQRLEAAPGGSTWRLRLATKLSQFFACWCGHLLRVFLKDLLPRRSNIPRQVLT